MITENNNIIQNLSNSVSLRNNNLKSNLHQSRSGSPQIFEPFRSYDSPQLRNIDKKIMSVQQENKNLLREDSNNLGKENINEEKFITLSNYMKKNNTKSKNIEPDNTIWNQVNSDEKFVETTSNNFIY